MRKIKSTLIAIAILCFASAQAEVKEDQITTKRGNTVLRNLRYAEAPEAADMRDSTDDRTFDLFIPQGVDKPYNVLVFVHGGGFSGGNKGGKYGYNTLCDALAKRGVAVMSINYRLHVRSHRKPGEPTSTNAGKGINPNGFSPIKRKAAEIASEDLSLALKWIAKHGKKYNIDKKNVAIIGGSAGGMTCLYVAYIMKKQPIPLRAVVNLWGCVEYMSEVRYNTDTPLISFHGEVDKSIHPDYSRELHKHLNAKGNKDNEYIEMEGKGHAQYNYVERTYCDKIIEFLNRYFK